MIVEAQKLGNNYLAWTELVGTAVDSPSDRKLAFERLVQALKNAKDAIESLKGRSGAAEMLGFQVLNYNMLIDQTGASETQRKDLEAYLNAHPEDRSYFDYPYNPKLAP